MGCSTLKGDFKLAAVGFGADENIQKIILNNMNVYPFPIVNLNALINFNKWGVILKLR